MPERTNGAALKAARPFGVSWVRIPVPPPIDSSRDRADSTAGRREARRSLELASRVAGDEPGHVVQGEPVLPELGLIDPHLGGPEGFDDIPTVRVIEDG